jgi:hypothetical protein
VLSEHSVASPHVGKEIERASSKRLPIMALRINEAPLSPALEYFLGESQEVDGRAGGIDAALAKLVTAIRDRPRDAPAIYPPATAGTSAVNVCRTVNYRFLPWAVRSRRAECAAAGQL